MAHIKLWTRCKHFEYAGLDADAVYSLPVFLRIEDAAETYFTDIEGWVLPCCRDYIYEALDHHLYWVRCKAPASGTLRMHVYCGMPGGCGGPRLSSSSTVLDLAEFFGGAKSTLLKNWEVECSTGGAPKLSIEPFLGVDDGGAGAPLCNIKGQTLWIEPGGDTILRHHVQPAPHGSRVHLRTHFYDDGEPSSSQWVGRQCADKSAAVGLRSSASPEQDFYGYSAGGLLISNTDWKNHCVPRSVGWHRFELIWEEQSLLVIIDSEPITMECNAGESCASDQVCLFSKGSGYGVWAGVELFYTPRGQSTWALGIQSPSEGACMPWELNAPAEIGYWQVLGEHVIQHVSVGRWCKLVDSWEFMEASFAQNATDPTVAIHPVMRKMLGSMHEVIEERADGMIGLLCPDGFLRFFPPAVQALPEEPTPEMSAPECSDMDHGALAAPPAYPRENHVETVNSTELAAARPVATACDAVRESQEVQAIARGVVLDCWSEPSESELQKIERVVAHFVQLMHQQGVALPQNINMVSQCKEASHKRCFVYRFGTRRLHFAARTMDDGRLLLVVRCGGGFMDFVEFARRHGGLEEIKLRKQLEATGVVRINRVLKGGSIQASQQ